MDVDYVDFLEFVRIFEAATSCHHFEGKVM